MNEFFDKNGVDLDLIKRLWELPAGELQSILSNELKMNKGQHNAYTRLLADLVEAKLAEEKLND